MSGGGSWRSSGTAIDLTLSDSGPETDRGTAHRAVERTSSSKSKRRAPRIVDSSSDDSSDDDDDGDDSIQITTAAAAARPVGQPPPPTTRLSDQSTAAVSRQPSTAGKSFEAPQHHAFHEAQSNGFSTNQASMFRTGPAHQKNPPPPPYRSRPLPPPPPRPWPDSGVNHHAGGTSTLSASNNRNSSAPTSTSFSGPVFSAAPPPPPPRNHPSWLNAQRRQPFASSSSSAHAPPAFQSNIKNFFTPRDPSSSSTSKPTPPPPRPLSVKERAMADLRAAQQRIGVPIAVPQNPPRAQTHRSTPKKNKNLAADRDDLDGLIDDDRALEDAMGSLSVRDDLNGGDQEAALKDLLSSVGELEDVDPNELPPPGLACDLLPHQIAGLAWLKKRESTDSPLKSDGAKAEDPAEDGEELTELKMPERDPKKEAAAAKKQKKQKKAGAQTEKFGGILADDMGLGKTVQMIALMLAHPSDRKACKSKTTLIVCPVSLMTQWKDEIEKKADGRLRVLIHHGKGKAEARKLQKYDVVITSYPTCAGEWPDRKKRANKKSAVANDSDDDEEAAAEELAKQAGPLFDPDYMFYRIILDEAHTIKNPTTGMHRACRALRSRYRWCLTGTPIQNSVMDMHALFAFLGPTVVRPLHELATFKSKIEQPIKNKRAKIGLARLSIVLQAVMLRRVKTQIINGRPLLQLPKREVIESKGPFLDAAEAEFYAKIEQKTTDALKEQMKQGGADDKINYVKMLTKLLRMRQACSHPSLVTKESVEDSKDALELRPAKSSNASSAHTSDADDLADLLGGISLQTRTCSLCSGPISANDQKNPNDLCTKCHDELKRYDRLKSSTKVKRTLQLLENIRRESAIAMAAGKPPKKTIIFSQWTAMFDVLEPFLRQGGFNYVRYTGQMHPTARAEATSRIKQDPNCTVILVSIKAGAVGLNLTCCSRVILLDLWWNPAIEEQAFDRAHRMGQQDDVKIYKLTIDDTVEDRILTLQADKAQLAKAALDGGSVGNLNKLSVKEILYLFKANADA
ncbi:hypothetical protein C6P46_000771 [Rhodotorula mucilaginosa]|uniref:Uncharacterized protein n=1 Tax=Rhodotorula mucilaginosa TaxID=5537 RepID=A0A9P7B2Y8_RHOMI|nr:hypothetical protein C6P46_000771 [Rhodotorula mucilaginosa]TKA51372.1 hypothetical protein B0A53_05303 [Rhodotorula sp. CCFEE 5036]